MLMDGVITFAGWGKFDITLLFFSLSLHDSIISGRLSISVYMYLYECVFTLLHYYVSDWI